MAATDSTRYNNTKDVEVSTTSLFPFKQKMIQADGFHMISIVVWAAVGIAITSALLASEQKKDDSHAPAFSVPTNKGSGWFLGGIDPELVLTSLPEIHSLEDLPGHWDWRNFNGTGISLTTSVLNQMVPRACGSCWAFATVSALSDRIRISKFKKTGRLDAEVLLSPQVLLDCGMRTFGSCRGGDPRYAHKWIHENGIVDSTCSSYVASHPSWIGGDDCAATQCHTCTMNGDCFVVEDPVKYRISEYGTLNFTNSEEFQLQAMNEIYRRGPIVVSMYSLTPEFKQYKGGYILRDSTKYSGTTHVVSLVGWGTDTKTGTKYWIVRNSIGTHWGDRGYFLIERGANTYNIENKGAWAVPIV